MCGASSQLRSPRKVLRVLSNFPSLQASLTSKGPWNKQEVEHFSPKSPAWVPRTFIDVLKKLILLIQHLSTTNVKKSCKMFHNSMSCKTLEIQSLHRRSLRAFRLCRVHYTISLYAHFMACVPYVVLAFVSMCWAPAVFVMFMKCA